MHAVPEHRPPAALSCTPRSSRRGGLRHGALRVAGKLGSYYTGAYKLYQLRVGANDTDKNALDLVLRYGPARSSKPASSGLFAALVPARMRRTCTCHTQALHAWWIDARFQALDASCTDSDRVHEQRCAATDGRRRRASSHGRHQNDFAAHARAPPQLREPEVGLWCPHGSSRSLGKRPCSRRRPKASVRPPLPRSCDLRGSQANRSANVKGWVHIFLSRF